MTTYKPFQFIRTVVVWGTDREDAEELLPEVLAEAHDDLLYGWEYDDESETPEFVDAMGGEVEVED